MRLQSLCALTNIISMNCLLTCQLLSTFMEFWKVSHLSRKSANSFKCNAHMAMTLLKIEAYQLQQFLSLRPIFFFFFVYLTNEKPYKIVYAIWNECGWLRFKNVFSVYTYKLKAKIWVIVKWNIYSKWKWKLFVNKFRQSKWSKLVLCCFQ